MVTITYVPRDTRPAADSTWARIHGDETQKLALQERHTVGKLSNSAEQEEKYHKNISKRHPNDQSITRKSGVFLEIPWLICKSFPPQAESMATTIKISDSVFPTYCMVDSLSQ